MRVNYRVVIKGVREGFTKEGVVGMVAPLFKLSPETVRALLETPAFTVKRGVELKDAVKYQAALEERGCVCIVEPEASPDLVSDTAELQKTRSHPQSSKTEQPAFAQLRVDTKYERVMKNIVTFIENHKFGVIFFGLIGLIIIFAQVETANQESDKIAADAAEAAQLKAAQQRGAELRRQRLAAMTPAERAAEERAAKKRADVAAKMAAKEAAEKMRIQEQDSRFGQPPNRSTYDGTYRVVEEYLEKNMNDPESLQMDRCTEVFRTAEGWLVGCSFRGKNSFGGLVRQYNWFTIQHDKVVSVHDESAYAR